MMKCLNKCESNKKIVAMCFLVNFILGILTIVPVLIRDKGMFSLGTDFDAVFQPIYNLSRDSILNGEICWNWSFDLGTDFIGANSFVALGSPFYILPLILGKIDYLYLGGWMFILKYAVAGATAGLYLCKFVKNKKYVLPASILYAFSGFQAVNLMFGSFHDAVALFPLLLFALEKLMEDKRRGCFALAVCLNALTNYYLFIGEVFFLVIYYVLRFWWNNWREWKRVFTCIAEGILGIMMAGIIFIPSALFIINNPRINGHISVSEWFLTNRRDMLKILRSFLFPGEMMQQWSCVREYDWSSSSAYLPLVGIVLVVCYVLKKKQKGDWLRRLVVVCTVFMVVPVLCSVFTLMTDVYCRWYYMPLLMFALASARVMEDSSEYATKKITVVIGLFLILLIIGFEWWDKNRFQVIFVKDAYWILNIIGLSGVLLTGIISNLKKENVRYLGYLIGISIFAVSTTGYTCARYREVRGYETYEYQEKIAVARELRKALNPQMTPYRLYNMDNVLWTSMHMFSGGGGYSYVEGSIIELWSMLGEKRRVVCPEIPEGFFDLVGAKYRITMQMLEDENWNLLQEIIIADKKYYLYEKEGVRPIGVTYNMYMLEQDFLKIPEAKRAMVMQDVIVVDEAEEHIVNGILMEYSEKDVIPEHHEISDFNRSGNQFVCSVSSSEESFVLFTIPYANGWRAYVNGEETSVLNTNGFMAIKVPKGENTIQFTYFNYNVAIGGCISILGFAVWIVLCRYKKRKHASFSAECKN